MTHTFIFDADPLMLVLVQQAHAAWLLRQSSSHCARLAPWQERRAKELLTADLAVRLTLEELAEACRLSVRHFTRAFRGSTGASVGEWLRRRRIEQAQRLLAHPSFSLADIAARCGFADQSHLTREFRRSTGVSPGAWRRHCPR